MTTSVKEVSGKKIYYNEDREIFRCGEEWIMGYMHRDAPTFTTTTSSRIAFIWLDTGNIEKNKNE